MVCHVYGRNKPSFRTFVDGKYRYIKTADYSGHRIADNIQDAQKYLQEYLKRGWDVKLIVEEV